MVDFDFKPIIANFKIDITLTEANGGQYKDGYYIPSTLPTPIEGALVPYTSEELEFLPPGTYKSGSGILAVDKQYSVGIKDTFVAKGLTWRVTEKIDMSNETDVNVFVVEKVR